MDPAGELRSSASAASILDRPVQELTRLRLVGEPGPEHLELEGERDEVLLRAVVEIALELPPRIDARLDDAGTRGSQLLDARAKGHFQRSFSRPGARRRQRLPERGPAASRSASWTMAATAALRPARRRSTCGRTRRRAGRPVGHARRRTPGVRGTSRRSRATRRRCALPAVSRTPPSVAGRGSEQSPLEGAQRSGEAVEDRDRDDRRGDRERGEHGAGSRPEGPRTEIAFASAASPSAA